MDFIHFYPSKIRVNPIGIVSSLSPPQCHIAGRRRHVTLPSHGAKTSSLPPLHLPETLRLIASPLELKPKY
jgi:hypothetical protein